MSAFGKQLHTQAYHATIMSILESKDSKKVVQVNAKKTGVVIGATVVGTLLLGPVGLLVGAAVGGGAASNMSNYDSVYGKMLDFLQTIDMEHKTILVEMCEKLVESSETEDLNKFVKSKENRLRLLHLVENFLSMEFDYQKDTGSPGTAKRASNSGYEAVPVDDNYLNTMP